MVGGVRAAFPSFIVWAFFLLFAAYFITVARTGILESFLMVLFASFSAVIATEGVHELSGHRPIGTLKEFSCMSREDLSMYSEKRIGAVNGALHIATGLIVFSSLLERAFFSEEFVLVLFFRSLIPVSIMLAFGSYWVNYGSFFKTRDGRTALGARGAGPAIRTTFSLLVAIGTSYGLARLFEII
ncbi:MAG: hypothetical protein AB7S83_05870 [Candidatus Methanomethylophilaceae archaeon]